MEHMRKNGVIPLILAFAASNVDIPSFLLDGFVPLLAKAKIVCCLLTSTAMTAPSYSADFPI